MNVNVEGVLSNTHSLDTCVKDVLFEYGFNIFNGSIGRGDGPVVGIYPCFAMRRIFFRKLYASQ
jgi:hypothetical protein